MPLALHHAGIVSTAKESGKVSWFCSSKTHTTEKNWLVEFAPLGRENLKMAGVQTGSRILATVKPTEKA